MGTREVVGALTWSWVVAGCATEDVRGEWVRQGGEGLTLLSILDDGAGEEQVDEDVDAACLDEPGRARLRIRSAITWEASGDEVRIGWTCESAALLGPGDCAVYGCGDVANALSTSLEVVADCEIMQDGAELACVRTDGASRTYLRHEPGDQLPAPSCIEPGNTCSGLSDCCEGSTCVTAGSAVTCAQLCEADGECETGCCGALLGGVSACLAAEYCAEAP
jgi:hypothetical protein